MTSARDGAIGGARESALGMALDAVVTRRVSGWSPEPTSDPDWDGALRVLVLVFGLRWEEAMVLDAALPAVPEGDRDAWWLRHAAGLWAAAGDAGPESDRGLAVLGRDDLPVPHDVLGRFAGLVLVEAALAHARLDLATGVVDRIGPALWEPLVVAGLPHPFGAVASVCRARVLAFRGDIAGADAVLRGIARPHDGPVRAVVAGAACLVGGNAADAADVRRLVDEVDRHAAEPDDLLSAGAQMLASFGEIALFEMAAAARRVLIAGGDADLARLDVIDRALSLEMLVALAVAEGDLDTAEAWADRVSPLLGSPIADSTAARALSRVALLAGRAEEAVAWAERAVARAAETDRVIERTEGEIVLNRARLEHPGTSGGDVARALAAMVADAERTGHAMARRAASRELRAAGLRLPPVAGSGWVGLSAREAAVARMVADGASNREVAQLLHVTEHTVRAHVSRALAAFGVATRSALPAAIGASGEGEPGGTSVRPGLTSRQREVAGLVAQGLGNEAIARALDLSPRTVERHVSDVLQRWQLPNRTALAHAWVSM